MYFAKKPRLPFEVPRTAAETDTPSLLDRQWCWWCVFQSPRPVRLSVPGRPTRRFNSHQIKHIGPGQPVVFRHLLVGCQNGCSACLSGGIGHVCFCMCLAQWHPKPWACPSTSGRMMEPSVRLPFCRMRPTGSLRAWIWARFKSLQMMSFRWWWCCCPGALLQQARPRRPRASTVLPHAHLWGSHALQPSLHFLIGESQTYWCDGWCSQPVAWMWWRRCHQSGSVNVGRGFVYSSCKWSAAWQAMY